LRFRRWWGRGYLCGGLPRLCGGLPVAEGNEGRARLPLGVAPRGGALEECRPTLPGGVRAQHGFLRLSLRMLGLSLPRIFAFVDRTLILVGQGAALKCHPRLCIIAAVRLRGTLVTLTKPPSHHDYTRATEGIHAGGARKAVSQRAGASIGTDSAKTRSVRVKSDSSLAEVQLINQSVGERTPVSPRFQNVRLAQSV
jgi:hypothetical protein